MNLSALEHIPLASAFLCETCQSVGNNERQCPACAGVNLLSLAGVLDRTEMPVGDSTVRQAAQDGTERTTGL
jgi:hypothetical protein